MLMNSVLKIIAVAVVIRKSIICIKYRDSHARKNVI